MRQEQSQSSGLPAKLLIVGHSGVGKTALLRRLTEEQFTPTESTSGIAVTRVRVANREASFIDTPGHAMESTREQIDHSTVVAALVVIDASSTRNVSGDVKHWLGWLERASIGDRVPRFLVAARTDRGPENARLTTLAQRHGFQGAFKTSAKDGTGIHELREEVLRAVPWPNEDDQDDPTRAAVIAAARTFSETLCALIAEDPRALLQLEWRQLEKVVATALEAVGFSVKLTPPSKDGGKDVIAICRVEGEESVFYCEIKHWLAGGRPGLGHVASFIEVNVEDRTDGGIFLSSSGYTRAVYGRLAEINRARIRLGGQQKIVSLCQHFVRSQDACWVPQSPLPELLFEDTLGDSGA